MPKLKENSVPAYRLHKPSGQAIVMLNGRDRVLGSHGTAESKAEYRRLIAEWLATGRHIRGSFEDATNGTPGIRGSGRPRLPR
jgi:hypothetical protein